MCYYLLTKSHKNDSLWPTPATWSLLPMEAQMTFDAFDVRFSVSIHSFDWLICLHCVLQTLPTRFRLLCLLVFAIMRCNCDSPNLLFSFHRSIFSFSFGRARSQWLQHSANASLIAFLHLIFILPRRIGFYQRFLLFDRCFLLRILRFDEHFVSESVDCAVLCLYRFSVLLEWKSQLKML